MTSLYPFTAATSALMAVVATNTPPATEPFDLVPPVSYIVLSTWALYTGIDLVLYTGVACLATAAYTLALANARIAVPAAIIAGAAIASPTLQLLPIVCSGLIILKHILDKR